MARDFKVQPTIDGAPVVASVEHGSDANVPRPNVSTVIWRGTVQPNNWTDADIWHDVSV